MALLDDPLVLVDPEDVRHAGRAGQVGGQRVESVEPTARGDCRLGARPGHGRPVTGSPADGHPQERLQGRGHDPGDPGLDLLACPVVGATEPVAYPGERPLGPGQRALSGLGHRAGLFGRPDVGDR